MSLSAPALRLLELIQSHRVTVAIHVAARLGIADRLFEGPASLDDLVKTTGADRQALRRLLAALCTIGICSRTDNDRYALSETGTALAAAARPSFKAWALLEGEMLTKSWGGMLDTIMTGKTTAQLLGIGDSFAMMARVPENVRIFNSAMAELTAIVTQDVLAAYDFNGISHLMDVGGGTGELVGAVLAKYPSMHATVFDLARCAERATAHIAELGLGSRASFVAGDFFASVPAMADAIILKSIIHDWDDEKSCSILGNCRRATPVGGKLLLVERIMPERLSENAEHRFHALSDLNMLRGPGGMERTEAQYRDLLDRTGFGVTAVVPAGWFNVIEARAV
jgi:hypothetical protein